MVKPTMCSLCRGDPERLRVVDRCISSGMSDRAIEDRVRTLGWKGERHAVAFHREHWETALLSREPLEVTRAIGDHERRQPSQARDLARLVRDRAVQALEDGDLAIDAKDGLKAQKMLDDRESRDQDRSLVVQMARMLHANAAPPRVIEGDTSDAIGSGTFGLRPARAPRIAQQRVTTDRSASDAALDHEVPRGVPLGPGEVRS